MTDRDALVERMQMALWDEHGERISDEAMATIVSIVMEEAARVAEAFPARTHRNLATAPLRNPMTPPQMRESNDE